MTTCTVRYELDSKEDTWTAELVELPQVHTYGRSVRQVRNRIREALWAWTNDKKLAHGAVLVDDVRVPSEVRQTVRKARREREVAERAQAAASESLRDAVQRLMKAGLSLRDTADVLGISFQRVQQLTPKRKTG